MSVSLYGSGQTVLQVVSATTTSQTVVSGATFGSTGLSVSITPQSTNSKILVMLLGGQMSYNAGTQASSTIYRGATNLGNATYGLSTQYSSGSNGQNPPGCGYLDSPSTTASTTYTVYINSPNGGTAYFNQNTTLATLVAMEISGS